jgi:phage host-nuclease inhibitor protein Gam
MKITFVSKRKQIAELQKEVEKWKKISEIESEIAKNTKTWANSIKEDYCLDIENLKKEIEILEQQIQELRYKNSFTTKRILQKKQA